MACEPWPSAGFASAREAAARAGTASSGQARGVTAQAFIGRYSRPGDVVIDPFSGRGTVPLQACAERRTGVGVDHNPLAALLTAAKTDAPNRREAEARLDRLRIDFSHAAIRWMEVAHGAAADPESALVPAAHGSGRVLERLPAAVAVSFHPRTLGQVLFLRTTLDPALKVDRSCSRRWRASCTGAALPTYRQRCPTRSASLPVTPAASWQGGASPHPSATRSCFCQRNSGGCSAMARPRRRASCCMAMHAMRARGSVPPCVREVCRIVPGSWSPARPTWG